MGAKASILDGPDGVSYSYYEDTQNSPRITADDAAGLRYTRVYRTPAYPVENVFGFVQALLGTTSWKSASPGPGEWQRWSPHRIVVNQSTQQWRNGLLTEGPIYAYANSISSIEYVGPRQQVPYDDDGGELHSLAKLYWPEAEEAVIHVEYATLPYVVKDDDMAQSQSAYGELDRYVSRKIQAAVQYLEQPGGYLYYEQTAEELLLSAAAAKDIRSLVNVGLGFPYAYFDVTYTHHKVLFPSKAINYCLGRTNKPASSTYSKKPWDAHTPDECFDGIFPPGTLVYLSVGMKDYTSSTGQLLYDVEHRFRFYPTGANYVYRQERAVQYFSRVSSSGLQFSKLSDLLTSPHSDPKYRTRLPFRHAPFETLFMAYYDDYPPYSTDPTSWETI